MSNDAKKLLPTYRRFYETPIRGKRTVVNITFLPKLSSSRQVNVTFPKLASNTHSKKKRAVLAPWGRFGFSKCEPFWPSMGPKQKTGAILATCRAILATF